MIQDWRIFLSRQKLELRLVLKHGESRSQYLLFDSHTQSAYVHFLPGQITREARKHGQQDAEASLNVEEFEETQHVR